MRPNPLFASEDPEVVRTLVREHPWATLVTSAGSGLAASHYPVLLDEDAPELTLLTHLGKPDEQVLEIEQGEVLVIVQGHHGYISPSWYSPEERLVPTWNFTVAHLHGTPQILGEEENLSRPHPPHRPLRAPPAGARLPGAATSPPRSPKAPSASASRSTASS